MKKIFLILSAAVVLSSCATMRQEPSQTVENEEIPEPSYDGVEPTPILELRNIELNGTNWMKTQFRDSRTGNPIANRKFIIYVIMGEKDSDIGEIITRSDADGWVYVKNIPDGACYGDFFLHED